MEEDVFRGIEELETEIGSKHDTVQVFAAGSCVFLAGVRREILTDLIKFRRKRKIQAEAVDDLGIAVGDGFQGIIEISVRLREIVAGVKHVGHFRVRAEALAGSGGNHETAVRVGFDDVFYFAKLVGIGKRTAAEFNDFDHKNRAPYWKKIIIIYHLTLHIFRKYARENVKIPCILRKIVSFLYIFPRLC